MFDDTAFSTVTSLWRRQNATDPDPSLAPSPDDIASQARYARLIVLHVSDHDGIGTRDPNGRLTKVHRSQALVGFSIAVICPLAICLVAIGKAHSPSWVLLHKRLMLYIVIPLTLICVTLAYAAGVAAPTETPLDAHKVMGLFMVFSVLVAIVTGDYTYSKYFATKTSKPRKKSPMSIWLHVQAGLGFLITPATQVLSGLTEWDTHVGSALPWYVPIVVWSTLAFFPTLLVFHWLIRGAYRMSHDGKSFRMAFFPPSTPREQANDPESRSLRDGRDAYDPDADDELDEKPARPRLKAKTVPFVQTLEYARLDSFLSRRAGDKTPISPRSVSAPSYPASASNHSTSTSNVPLRSPPPPFSPPPAQYQPLVYSRPC
ncbi:hypothetical protein JCM10212_003477 [Sporobolomyces blumeae]